MPRRTELGQDVLHDLGVHAQHGLSPPVLQQVVILQRIDHVLRPDARQLRDLLNGHLLERRVPEQIHDRARPVRAVRPQAQVRQRALGRADLQMEYRLTSISLFF